MFNGFVINIFKKILEFKRIISNKKNESSNKNEFIRNCVKRNKSLLLRLRKLSKLLCLKVVFIEVVEEVIIVEE